MAQGHKTGGRQKGTPNKATARLKEYAQQYDEETIDFLVSVMRGFRIVEENGAPVRHLIEAAVGERVDAAKELLNRAHGRPAQEITADVEHAGAIQFVVSHADERL